MINVLMMGPNKIIFSVIGVIFVFTKTVMPLERIKRIGTIKRVIGNLVLFVME